MQTQPKLIYMLEDDSDDVYITETTIKELCIPVALKVFSKSDEFLHFLFTAEKASLILIDYNSNPDNGVEVLKMIKADTLHKSTPVVILSDNTFKEYKDECYALGASSFIQKPSQMNKTTEVIGRFFDYWITIAEV